MLSSSQPLYYSALYSAPHIYNRVFAPEDDELAFWKKLLSVSGGTEPILDLGCGSCNVLQGATQGPCLALDIDASLLAANPSHLRVRADMLHLPLRHQSVAAVASRLFAVAYAAGPEPELLHYLGPQLGSILKPGAVVALELPVAYHPNRLQGIQETAQLAADLHYTFRYQGLLKSHEYGQALDTEILVQSGDDFWKLYAPLFVFTPEGVSRWLASMGLSAPTYYAPYDLATATSAPPSDCLRAVVTAHRQS